MTVALWDVAQVTAVADAIRAKNGKTATMTVAQMPEEIAALIAKGRREVWLHAPVQKNGALFIDTGVAGDMEHTLEVVGYGNIYSSSTLFGSVTANTSRQVVDLLTSTMKWRFAWGNSGLKTYEYPVETISPWHPAVIRFNKSGFTVNGFTRGFAAATVSDDYSASVTGGASTANYVIFPSLTKPNEGGYTGVFRSAKVFAADGATLLHHFVPVMYGDFSLALLDKVTGTEQALPSGADGYEAYWAPYTDALVNLTA